MSRQHHAQSYLQSYATTWQRDPDNNFAVACFQQNTIDELLAARTSEPDATDMATWQISAEEWQEAVTAAYFAKLHKNIPYLQLYRFGAAAFFVSVLSLLSWLFTGIALPFHHVFALAVIPPSLGFMLMAYLTKKYSPHGKELGARIEPLKWK